MRRINTPLFSLRKFFLYGAALASVFAPHVVFAQGAPSGIQNPIKFSSISEFLKAIIDVIVLIGIPVAAVAIIYAGFLFVTAGGSEEKLSTAKKTLLWTVIGVAILLGAEVIMTAIENTITNVTP